MDETAVANTLAFLRASEANEKKAVYKSSGATRLGTH